MIRPNNNNPYEDAEEDSVDFSQFRPGSSEDMKTGEGRSDYQDVRVCDVNSNSDVSLQQKRQLNTHLRKLKNKRDELKILRESNEAGSG